MSQYIIRRLLQAIPLLIIISLLLFVLMRSTGDPLATMGGRRMTRPEDRARLSRLLGLDKPIYVQYLYWLIGNDWAKVDMDGDGVLDGADACPSTPPAQKVDAKGCEYIRGRMIFPGVRFVGQTARLAPGAEFEVRRVAELIRAHPEVQVEVGGHTDAPGGPEENLRLSLKRAERVRAVLIQMGVNARQLTARGYGVSAPLLLVGPPTERRAKNVRIEFRFSVNQPPAE